MPAPSSTPRAPRLVRSLVVLAATASLVAQINPASAAVVGKASSFRVATAQNPVLDRTEVVRWNPCSVIGYRVNAALGGRRALADSKAAVDRLAAASGLRFRYLGTTAHVPSAGRPAPADTQLVIAWARPSGSSGGSSHLGPGEVGRGGWRATSAPSGRYQITSGYVVVRAGAPLAMGFGRGVSRGRVLIHELGHAVGLDHVADPLMVMHSTVTPRSPAAAFQAGDLAGLRKVGRPAGCIS